MKMNKTVTRVLTAGLAVVGLVVATVAVPMDSARDGALAWAKSLSTAERMTVAQAPSFRGLPDDYRMAVLSTLASPEERADNWLGVFRAYRATHSLTGEQDALLARAEALIKPDLFVGQRTQAQDRAIAEVRMRIEKGLGPEAKRYLFRLREAIADGQVDLPTRERFAWMVRSQAERLRIFGRLDASANWCTCKVGGDDCTYSMNCNKYVACDEKGVWWGCGDNNICNGTCNYHEND